jgi:G3E family GTPase
VARAPIPVFLVTGFLGSGKTTLLWKWLHEAPVSGLRPAVVMNDFGDVSVDSLLLGRPDVPLETVAGGCVCCADDAQLGHAVKRLARTGDRSVILVETSGLAEPDAVVDQLTDVDVAEVARLHGVFTVVDAAGFSLLRQEIAEWRLAERQIQFASVVFLSRCDLASEAAVEAVKAEIARVNPAARIVRLPFALPELPDLLREPACTLAVGPATTGGAHLHHRYLSLTFALPRAVPRAVLGAFLQSLDRRQVLRGKGFVRLAESPDTVHVFHYVAGRHSVEALPDGSASPPLALVLIGPGLDRVDLADRIRRMVGADPGALQLGIG